MGNKIRTKILLAVMTALIIWIGQIFGGRGGGDGRGRRDKFFLV